MSVWFGLDKIGRLRWERALSPNADAVMNMTGHLRWEKVVSDNLLETLACKWLWECVKYYLKNSKSKLQRCPNKDLLFCYCSMWRAVQLKQPASTDLLCEQSQALSSLLKNWELLCQEHRGHLLSKEVFKVTNNPGQKCWFLCNAICYNNHELSLFRS